MSDRVLEKAFELAVKEVNNGIYGFSRCPNDKDCFEDEWIGKRDCDECWRTYLMEKARKELNG